MLYILTEDTWYKKNVTRKRVAFIVEVAWGEFSLLSIPVNLYTLFL